ncbi:retrovirus-related pol polyprotein from transposon TNT 1-94 [Tanacetum coccineum]
MASEHSSSGPALHDMTPVTISSGLVPNPPSSTPFVPPSRSDWDLLFQPMFDESLNPPPYVDLQAPEVIAPIPEVVAPEHAVSTGSPSSTTVDQDAPSPSNSHTTQETQTPIISHDVEEDNHDIEVAHMGNDLYFGIPIPEVTSDQSSSSDVIHIIVPLDHQVSKNNNKWTKDHPLENIIAMQEELHEFKCLEVWELVPPPDKAFVITLKWIYKVNLYGVDLLTGSRGDNIYTLSLGNMMASSPICLLSKASKTKSWLWHRRLSHLNFGAINHLARHGLVRGLPKLKFEKDYLCSACALGKSSKKPHKPKSEDTNQEKLYLLHMDLCGPMRVASVNGKKYILVIVDDYSRFT